jgi:ferrochelatase
MTTTHLPPAHPEIAHGRVGVLLINLGTPDGTDYWSMRRYLKEFLSDRRVIETNRLIWWPVLNGIILTTRPSRSGRAYASIWNRERDESPLRTITRSQADRLAAALAGDHPQVTVDWAMRYGQPSIADKIRSLMAAGCDRIVLFALYPQYAAATTATVFDKVFDTLKTMRWQPAVRTNPPYHDDRHYIEALAASVGSHLGSLAWQPEVMLASFHGLPKEYFDKGDPYHCHCAKTARLLRQALGWEESKLRMTFQSRFGPAEWLQPYTDETVIALAKAGVKSLAVITPGFAADCVETLEEIAVEAGHLFRKHGGENFTVVPCLNDSEVGMAMVKSLVLRELQGWIPAAG